MRPAPALPIVARPASTSSATPCSLWNESISYVRRKVPSSPKNTGLGSLPAFVFPCSIAYPSAAKAGAIAWRTSFDSIRFACVTVESISGRVAAKTPTSGYTQDGGFVELGKKRQRG
jgi:hypothetical protein